MNVLRSIATLTPLRPSKMFEGGELEAGIMKLYRINKVNKPGGMVLKKKDVLAVSDEDAVQKAEDSQDCPICDVLKDGQHVASIV